MGSTFDSTMFLKFALHVSYTKIDKPSAPRFVDMYQPTFLSQNEWNGIIHCCDGPWRSKSRTRETVKGKQVAKANDLKGKVERYGKGSSTPFRVLLWVVLKSYLM